MTLTWDHALYVVVMAAVAAWLNWRQKRRDRHLAAKVDDNTAKTETAVKLGAKTYASVNGTGITGALRRIEAEQKAHAADDVSQFGELRGVIGLGPWGGRDTKPPAGGGP